MKSWALAGLLLAAAAAVQAQAAKAEPSRGQMLYETHCIACHTSQMHWRTLNQARDWDSLRAQVRRWQGVAALNWSEADIDAVADHLNRSIYQFVRPQAAR